MQAPPTSLQQIELLIEARWVIPVIPEGVTLEHHAIAIDRGRIVALLPITVARERYSAQKTLHLDEHALLPGLVNLHCHAAMSLLRGYADDLSLQDWLNKRIWPAEQQYLSSAFVHDGTLLAACEMLRGGITTCNDMYYYPEAAANAYREAGMRASLGITVIEFPTPYANDADDYLNKGLAVRDALRDDPLLRFNLAPHAPYTITDRTFERIGTLSAQLDIPVHMHIHEGREEIEESLKNFGKRPLERLKELGLLSPNLIAVHGVHVNSTEIALLAQYGCSVAHCPTSNMKLASGIAPITAMLAQGVRVGLGSDGAASNNRLDLLQEMRHAALLAKVASNDVRALMAHQAIRMATYNGAEALGMEQDIGSIEPGKLADLCAIRLDDWAIQPCFDPASHIVYAVGREHISHVWVAGDLRVNAGQIIGINNLSLIASVKLWQNRLSS